MKIIRYIKYNIEELIRLPATGPEHDAMSRSNPRVTVFVSRLEGWSAEIGILQNWIMLRISALPGMIPIIFYVIERIIC